METSYLTDGLNWQTDYSAVMNPTDTCLDLNGWATIDNRSGASYENTRIKLVSGDVRRKPPQHTTALAAEMASARCRAGFAQSWTTHTHPLGQNQSGKG